MKRILSLAMALAFVLGFAALGSAAELKIRGEYRADFSWTDNQNFKETGDTAIDGDGFSEDDFEARQRMRVRFAYVASETLQAVLQLEVGDSRWGRPGQGADLGADDTVVEVKSAYLDFNWPGSEVNVKVGVQDVSFPWSGYFESSPLMADDAAAVIVSVPFNKMVAMAFGWTRIWDTESGNGQNAGVGPARNNFDEADVLFLAVPITPEGMKIVPYGAFAQVGKDAATNARLTGLSGLYLFDNLNPVGGANLAAAVNDADGQTTAWWAGLAFELTMFDPFVFYFDFVYGSWSQDDVNATLPAVAARGRGAQTIDELSTSGFIVDAALKYKGFNFVTPELYFAYASGNGSDALSDGELGTIPFVFDEAWTPTGVSFWGGTGFSGNQGDRDFKIPGHWTVGLALRNFSFLDKLTHDLIVSYIRGTHDEDFVKEAIDRGYLTTGSSVGGYSGLGSVMSTKDSVWTVDFNHKYMIYEQLAAHIELGYMSANFDEDTWTQSNNGTAFADDTKDAWKVLLGLKYKF